MTDPDTAPRDRRARYANAVCGGPGGSLAADRVMAVADAELADLKAEIEQATRSQCFWQESYVKMQQGWHEEVDRLREEATWAQLRAETGAERAQTEQAALNAECGKAYELLRQARATIERVKALVRPLGILYAALPGLYASRCKLILDDLRAALDAPTEPAPDPDTDDGSGLWLSTPLADPEPVDPLAASKARLEAAMRGMAT